MDNQNTYLESKPHYEILSIALAYASMKLYDIPVRDWLKRHWLMKK